MFTFHCHCLHICSLETILMKCPKNAVHDLMKKEYLLLPKSVWLFVGPTFLLSFGSIWHPVSFILLPWVSIFQEMNFRSDFRQCYTMIIRQHCSVMILPFLPALEPRLDLFVIIHHPFPLSSCIISIILRVSTWLNLIHLTKKKKKFSPLNRNKSITNGSSYIPTSTGVPQSKKTFSFRG